MIFFPTINSIVKEKPMIMILITWVALFIHVQILVMSIILLLEILIWIIRKIRNRTMKSKLSEKLESS
jgi:hypothetical protein